MPPAPRGPPAPTSPRRAAGHRPRTARTRRTTPTPPGAAQQQNPPSRTGYLLRRAEQWRRGTGARRAQAPAPLLTATGPVDYLRNALSHGAAVAVAELWPCPSSSTHWSASACPPPLTRPTSTSEGHRFRWQTETIGIIMNGVSGRMGYRQHLVRSILAIREQGGVLLGNGERVQVEPLLVGRSEAKLARAGRAGTASPTTPPTSTPPWPTRAGRSTPTSWSPRPAPRRSARPSRRARRSTPRSRPPRAWSEALELAALAAAAGHQERRRARQALPARPAEAAPA